MTAERHEARTGRQVVLAALCLTLFASALLSDALFSSRVLTQLDALEQFEPWESAEPGSSPPSNEVLLDQSLVMQPWLFFCAERVREGELPLWNPGNYCGQPMVATYQSAVYWPLNWVYFLFPSWSFFEWSALLRLVAAGLFAFLYLRRLSVGAGPSLVGATGFMLSGFFVAWLGHMHTHVALFLPALFWSVERVAARPRPREYALFGLFVGLALLAGHVQTAAHVLLAVGAYALFRAWRPLGAERSSAGARLAPRSLLALAGATGIGVLLALPQLLPFAEYLGVSQGARVLETVDQVDPVALGDAAVLMVAPKRFGSPATHDYSGPRGHNLNYNELIGGYVGHALLALALFAVVRRYALRRREVGGAAVAFLLGAALLAALVAWQVSPFYELFRSVPKLRSTKLMRLLLVVAFGASSLGAIGLAGLVRDLELGARAAGALCAVVLAVVGGELLAFGRGYNPAVERSAILPRTDATDYLSAQPGLWRALGVDNTILIPSANLFYGVPLVSGYDSIEYRAMTELVARMSSSPGGQLFIKEIPSFDRGFGIADLLGVRYLLSEAPLPPRYTRVLDGELDVYENPRALPRAFVPREVRAIADSEARLDFLGADGFDPYVAVIEGPLPHAVGQQGTGTAEVASYAPRNVRISASMDAPGLVVLTDVWAPGWTARVDGREAPIERVDHALRGVWVDAGEHEIEMRYDPLSTRLGLMGGALGLALLVAIVLRDRG